MQTSCYFHYKKVSCSKVAQVQEHENRIWFAQFCLFQASVLKGFARTDLELSSEFKFLVTCLTLKNRHPNEFY